MNKSGFQKDSVPSSDLHIKSEIDIKTESLESVYECLSSANSKLIKQEEKKFENELTSHNSEVKREHLCLFSVGDLVWVNMKGHPLWPGMISNSENESTFTKLKFQTSFGKPSSPRQYYIQFFGGNHQVMWASSKVIFPYEGLELLAQYFEKLKLNIKSRKNSSVTSLERNLFQNISKMRPLLTFQAKTSKALQWYQAIEEADRAATLERQERNHLFKEAMKKEENTRKFKKSVSGESSGTAENRILDSASVSIEISSRPFVIKKLEPVSDSIDSIDEFSAFETGSLVEKSFALENENTEKDQGAFALSDSSSAKWKPYRCSECNYESSNKSDSQKHAITHCRKKSRLKRHFLKQNKFINKFLECEFTCKDKSSLKSHYLTHSSTKLYKCLECDYTCNFKFRLKLHSLKHVDNSIKSFRCLECEYTCYQESHIKRHLLKHDGDIKRVKASTKLFTCSECDYVTVHKNSLNVHAAIHAETRLFKCSECRYESNTRENLRFHLLNHHTNLKLFKCSECDYECNRGGDMKIHLLRHAGKKRFNCPTCSYTAVHTGTLNRHLLTHSPSIKKFKCFHCDYETMRKDTLKIHILNHSNEKRFKCPECIYGSNSKGDFDRHAVVHSKQNFFRCLECDYKCKRKDRLRRHLNTHLNLGLLKCALCSYKCIEKRDLKLHIFTHSNTKLFNCPKCGYGCNRNDVLRRHLLTHANA